MSISGTTIVEASLEKRQAIGIDIDPLALRLGRAKTMANNLFTLRDSWNKVIKKANELLFQKERIEQTLSQFFDDRTKSFVDYWFLPETQRELMALAMAIQEITDKSSRHFLELIFSSIIITKSGGVSKARDLAHSRPHLRPGKLASLALGTGDLDCVYHFSLTELREAVEKVGGEDQMEMLSGMIDGRRLRDISDLPFDLAI